MSNTKDTHKDEQPNAHTGTVLEELQQKAKLMAEGKIPADPMAIFNMLNQSTALTGSPIQKAAQLVESLPSVSSTIIKNVSVSTDGLSSLNSPNLKVTVNTAESYGGRVKQKPLRKGLNIDLISTTVTVAKTIMLIVIKLNIQELAKEQACNAFLDAINDYTVLCAKSRYYLANEYLAKCERVLKERNPRLKNVTLTLNDKDPFSETKKIVPLDPKTEGALIYMYVLYRVGMNREELTAKFDYPRKPLSTEKGLELLKSGALLGDGGCAFYYALAHEAGWAGIIKNEKTFLNYLKIAMQAGDQRAILLNATLSFIKEHLPEHYDSRYSY